MKIAITQANFIPWYAYFHLISKVDKFYILDNVKFGDRSFTNRNFIFSNKKKLWLTLSINAENKKKELKDITIEPLSKTKIKKILFGHYPISDKSALSNFFDETLNNKIENLTDLNIFILKKICNFFSLKTEILKSSDFQPKNNLTTHEYLKQIMIKSKCTEYYNFQKGIELKLQPYDDEFFFKKNNIKLFKQNVIKIINSEKDIFLKESIIKLIISIYQNKKNITKETLLDEFKKYSNYITYERIY